MSSSRPASFAPYAPPPDDPSYRETFHHASSSRPNPRPWFPVQPSAHHVPETSYQSGGIPTFGTSASGGGRVDPIGELEDSEVHTNHWETRYGLRVDVLAACAYIIGPISAFVLLIIETQNDYVRFHAYQSALFTSPLVLLRIFASLAHFPGWLCTMFTLLLVVSSLFMAFQAYRGAAQSRLVRFYIPHIGPLADRWVTEE